MNLKEFFVKSCPACHQVLVLNKTPSGLECKHCGEPLKWERDWKAQIPAMRAKVEAWRRGEKVFSWQRCSRVVEEQPR